MNTWRWLSSAFLGMLVPALALAVSPVNVHPTCVAQPAPCFTSIQAAVNAVSAPGEVRIAGGFTYVESVDLSGMNGGMPGDITIESVNGTAFIDAPPGTRAIDNTEAPYPGNVSIINLSIRAAAQPDTAPIHGTCQARSTDCLRSAECAPGETCSLTENQCFALIGTCAVDSDCGADVDCVLEGFCSGGLTLCDESSDCPVNETCLRPGRDGINLDDVEGDVLLQDLTANGSHHDGVDVDANGTITLIDSQANGNGGDGFQLWSRTEVIVRGSIANANGSPPQSGRNGFDIRALPTADVSVEITNSRADDNFDAGFDVEAPSFEEATLATLARAVVRESSADRNGKAFECTDRAACTVDDDCPTYPENSTPGSCRFSGFCSRTLFCNSDADCPGVDNVCAGSQSAAGIEIGSARGEYRDAEMSGFEAIGNVGHGVLVEISGNIVVADITANENGQGGIKLGSPPEPPDSVRMTRIVANGNAESGLNVERVEGDILLEECVANGNGILPVDPGEDDTFDDGAQLQTQRDTIGDITVRDCTFEGNGQDGLKVRGNGDVRVVRVRAVGNGVSLVDSSDGDFELGDGIDLDGFLADPGSVFVPASITVFDSVASENRGDGLTALSAGMIDICGVTMQGNGVNGALVYQAGGMVRVRSSAADSNAAAGVCLNNLLNGANQARGNNITGNARGLVVDSSGAVNVDAADTYWGGNGGPSHADNPGGSGDSVVDGASGGGSGLVDFSDFSNQPAVPDIPCDPSLTRQAPALSPAMLAAGLLTLAAIAARRIRRQPNHSQPIGNP